MNNVHTLCRSFAPVRHVMCLLATGCLLVFSGGCNIVGPAVVLIHGPEKADAQFELDEKRATIVFVDDRANRMDRRVLRQSIATVCTERLLKEDKVKTMLDPKAALVRVSGEPTGEPTDLVTLGKSLGAEVILYATVDAFSLSADGVSFQPNAQFRIKVIDCVNVPSRIWPEEPNGFPLAVTMPQRQGEAPKNGTQYNQAQDRLAQACGEELAKVFYKHQIKDRVSDTNDRK
ncbi:MAG: hypothetical protein NTV94_02855 [Planctomycetota bacterium]|nr:hypothetical protein [Planctomycetota bacterium]